MISQINDKFGGRIMKEFVKPKMYQDDIWQIMSILEKKSKITKTCIIKQEIKLADVKKIGE